MMATKDGERKNSMQMSSWGLYKLTNACAMSIFKCLCLSDCESL
jgi:hypothetical protein